MLNRLRRPDIKKLFNKNNVKHIYLVWSFSRWEETIDSDIDLIYEEWDRSIWWLFNFIKMKNNLEKILLKKVDLVDNNSINKYYKKSIEQNKILIF